MDKQSELSIANLANFENVPKFVIMHDETGQKLVMVNENQDREMIKDVYEEFSKQKCLILENDVISANIDSQVPNNCIFTSQKEMPKPVIDIPDKSEGTNVSTCAITLNLNKDESAKINSENAVKEQSISDSNIVATKNEQIDIKCENYTGQNSPNNCIKNICETESKCISKSVSPGCDNDIQPVKVGNTDQLKDRAIINSTKEEDVKPINKREVPFNISPKPDVIQVTNNDLNCDLKNNDTITTDECSTENEVNFVSTRCTSKVTDTAFESANDSDRHVVSHSDANKPLTNEINSKADIAQPIIDTNSNSCEIKIENCIDEQTSNNKLEDSTDSCEKNVALLENKNMPNSADENILPLDNARNSTTVVTDQVTNSNQKIPMATIKDNEKNFAIEHDNTSKQVVENITTEVINTIITNENGIQDNRLNSKEYTSKDKTAPNSATNDVIKPMNSVNVTETNLKVENQTNNENLAKPHTEINSKQENKVTENLSNQDSAVDTQTQIHDKQENLPLLEKQNPINQDKAENSKQDITTNESSAKSNITTQHSSTSLQSASEISVNPSSQSAEEKEVVLVCDTSVDSIPKSQEEVVRAIDISSAVIVTPELEKTSITLSERDEDKLPLNVTAKLNGAVGDSMKSIIRNGDRILNEARNGNQTVKKVAFNLPVINESEEVHPIDDDIQLPVSREVTGPQVDEISTMNISTSNETNTVKAKSCNDSPNDSHSSSHTIISPQKEHLNGIKYKNGESIFPINGKLLSKDNFSSDKYESLTKENKIGESLVKKMNEALINLFIETTNNNEEFDPASIKKAAYQTFTKLYGKELAAQEDRYKKQVDDLTRKLGEKQQEVKDLSLELKETRQATLQKDFSAQRYETQIEELKTQIKEQETKTEGVRIELRLSKNEIELSKANMRHLEEELSKANELTNSLREQNTSRSRESARYKELEDKVKSLEDRLKKSEFTRRDLETSLTEIETERDEELKIVQGALDEAAEEREELISSFKRELELLNTTNTAREQQMLDDFEWKLHEMEKEYKTKLEENNRLAEERLRTMRSTVESELSETLSTVTEERKIADEKLMKNTLQRVKRHADEEEVRQKLEKLRNEINAEWEDKLRQECSRLKSELDKLHSEEKHLAVESMKVQKEQETQRLKKSWEQRREEMANQITSLKDTLSDKEAYYRRELDNRRTTADRDVWDLRMKLQKLNESSFDQKQLLEEKYTEDTERLKVDYEDRIKELESRLAICDAQKGIDMIGQLEKEHKLQMQHVGEQHQLSMERLQEELEGEKFQAVEDARVIITNHHLEIESNLREQLTEMQKNESQIRDELEAVRFSLQRREEALRTLEDELDRYRDLKGDSYSSTTSSFPPATSTTSSGFSSSQFSLASSNDSHGSRNSQDRYSIHDSASLADCQDESQRNSGLLGKVFGGGWFTPSKSYNRRGSTPLSSKKPYS